MKTNSREVRNSIFKTLCYADCFDYPLTKEELWQFLISTATIDRTMFGKVLTEFPPLGWEHENGFYFLCGRQGITKKRNERKLISRDKLRHVRKIIKLLSFVPTVLLIGISGGLALDNSREEDDIDLFVITSRGNIWLTRLILILLLKLMGQYRGQGKRQSQKFCLNMLLDEEALTLSKERQNLYSAHEVIQLLPMFERRNIYREFLNANLWITKFLPNGLNLRRLGDRDIKRVKEKLFYILISRYLNIFEHLAKTVQLIYIKRHITTETISDHFLAFHPFDYKNYVLNEYNKRLKHLRRYHY